MHKIPRFMIAAPSSGTGKTTVVCGILKALKNRGLNPCSFKTGPDYIDPEFHRQAMEIPSHNLDLFFVEKNTAKGLLNHYSQGYGVAVLEGVMGFYDGIGTTSDASSWDTAKTTETPVVLVVNPKGMAISVVPLIQGFLQFQDSNIQGIILNKCSASLYQFLSDIITEHTGLPVLGYLPDLPELAIESRHLGLVATESKELSEKLDKLGKQVEETIDLDALLQLGDTAPTLMSDWSMPCKVVQEPLRIGVAKDEAFFFLYDENIDILKSLGAEICTFSPLADNTLPEHLDAIYLGGGYPEIHAKKLSENTNLKLEIKQQLENGMPVIAEGGGMLYLQDELEDMDGVYQPMVGFLAGKGYRTDRLGRFGYLNITTKEELFDLPVGTVFRGHEFHYWQSTNEGEDCSLEKPTGKRNWVGNRTTSRMFAGFQHLYFPSTISLVTSFIKSAEEYQKERNEI